MSASLEFQPHLDAARCREIGKALSQPLLQFRMEMNADVVYLIFRHHSRAYFDVVASNCVGPSLFLVGETIAVEGHLSPRVPQSIPRIRIASTLWSSSCEITSVLTIPWKHADGIIWLIVGNLSRIGIVRSRACTPSQLRLAETVKNTYGLGALKASKYLGSLFQKSVDRLKEAERAFNTQTLLEEIAATARWFFNTSSAYVALPSAQPDKFTFVATQRVRTAEFRRLSLGVDEGMSGLVRRKRQTARTTNYAEDPRLKHGPMRETLQEGFKSAVCTPLWREQEVSGLLYVAQRTFRAFNDIEVGLLEEFAALSSEAINADEVRISHEECIRRAERECISEQLHDHVVSYLLEMGITARMTAAHTSDSSSREAFEAIQKKAQCCLDAVRTCIGGNSGLGASRPTILRNIARELRSLPSNGAIMCETVIDPVVNKSSTVDAEVADALRVIGSEALKNAELHSGGTTVRVLFDWVDDKIRLAIEDNGRGVPLNHVAELLDRPGHLGLQRMRTIATRIGGTCKFGRSSLGGFRVVASLPTNRSEPGST